MSLHVSPAARIASIALLLVATLHAQPTFWTLAIQDDPPLDLAPLPNNVGTGYSVFVTRATLSPAARSRLAAGLGFEQVTAIDAAAPGPAILSRVRPGRIPGDARLRIERDGAAIAALGHGVSVEESITAANAEVLSAAILVGPHHEAVPPAGWVRYGEAEARPVVWTRGVHVQAGYIEGSCRRITFMDGPMHAAPSDALLRRYYAHKRQGPFPLQLQGLATNPDGSLFWSWTDRIIKTDPDGVVLASVEVPVHQGDLTWHDGHVVVAVHDGKRPDPEGDHKSWLWVFDDDTLAVIAKHRLPEVRYGAGGVCWADGRYVVVGGLPLELRDDATAANEVHEYDAEFRWLRSVQLGGGWTRLGIQTAEFAYGRFVFGCYGEPGCVLIASPDLRHVERLDAAGQCAHGIAKGPGGLMMVGWDRAGVDGHQGGLMMLPLSQLWYRN